MTLLQTAVQNSFILVFAAFAAFAYFLYTERDRVPEQFKTLMRVSSVYIGIAAVMYYYMQGIYREGLANGETVFPTHFRYIDWWLTTPLMLIKFPMLLGLGERGRNFMIRLVVLDLAMITTGYIGEIMPENQLIHNGMFLVSCLCWLVIIVMMFNALSDLPDHVGSAVKKGVRAMGLFVLAGWVIYPIGYFAPMLGVPADVRELVYNFADLVNKGGLCLLVYLVAKATSQEEVEAYLAEQEALVGAEMGAQGEPEYAGV